MKKTIKLIVKHIFRFVDYVSNDHMTAYATTSAYFIILAFIPFLMVLLTSVQFTPLTKDMVSELVLSVTPDGFHSLLSGIIDEVYSKSVAIVPISAIMAIWSSGKGMQAITNGLNVIYNCRETRNYVVMRLRSIFYTLIFVAAIIITLILMVFGNRIQLLLGTKFQFITRIVRFLMNTRVILVTGALSLFFAAMFTFLPNHKEKFFQQLPGAIFSGVAWSVCSFAFSIYIDSVQGASIMYGSLTTIVMVLLWMYFCMYLLLIGAEVNMILQEKNSSKYKM